MFVFKQLFTIFKPRCSIVTFCVYTPRISKGTTVIWPILLSKWVSLSVKNTFNSDWNEKYDYFYQRRIAAINSLLMPAKLVFSITGMPALFEGMLYLKEL